MEALTPTHLALILLGFLVLFGYKRLPDAARSLGRSMRIFRSEMKAMSAEETSPGSGDTGAGDTGPSMRPTAEPSPGS